MRIYSLVIPFVFSDYQICLHGAVITEKFLPPRIIIGEKSLVGEYANISCVNKIVLGKNVLLGRWVTIIDYVHVFYSRTFGISAGKSTFVFKRRNFLLMMMCELQIKLPFVQMFIYTEGL